MANGNNVPKDTNQILIQNEATVKNVGIIKSSESVQEVLPEILETDSANQSSDTVLEIDADKVVADTLNYEQRKESKEEAWSTGTGIWFKMVNGSKNHLFFHTN